MQKMGATYVLMGVRATLSIYNSLHGSCSWLMVHGSCLMVGQRRQWSGRRPPPHKNELDARFSFPDRRHSSFSEVYPGVCVPSALDFLSFIILISQKCIKGILSVDDYAWPPKGPPRGERSGCWLPHGMVATYHGRGHAWETPSSSNRVVSER